MRKWVVALLLLLLDWLTFFVPLGSLLLAYIIICKPKDVMKLIEEL